MQIRHKYFLVILILTLAGGLCIYLTKNLSKKVHDRRAGDANSLINSHESITTNRNDESSNIAVLTNNGSAHIPNARTDVNVEELFKTVVDEKNGNYACVSGDRSIVTLKSASGQVLASVDVIDFIKNIPMVGERKVNGIKMFQGKLGIYVGRGFMTMDVTTGKPQWEGTN